MSLFCLQHTLYCPFFVFPPSSGTGISASLLPSLLLHVLFIQSWLCVYDPRSDITTQIGHGGLMTETSTHTHSKGRLRHTIYSRPHACTDAHLHPSKLFICPRCHTQHLSFFFLSFTLFILQPKASGSNRGVKRNKQLINPPLARSCIFLPN